MDAAVRIKEALQSLGDALGHFISEAPERIVGALNERLSPRLSDMDEGIAGIAKSCDRLESMILSLPGPEDRHDLTAVVGGLQELRSMLQGISREPGCLGMLSDIKRSIELIQQRLADGNLERARAALMDLIASQTAAVSGMENARIALEQAANKASGNGLSATIAMAWNLLAIETFKIEKLTINPLTVKVSILSLAGAALYFNIGEITNYVLSSAQKSASASVAETDMNRIAKEISKLKGGSDAERKAITEAFERLEQAMKSGKPEARKAGIEILVNAVNKVSDQAAQTIAAIVGDINTRLALIEGGIHITNVTQSDPATREALARIEKLLAEKPKGGADKPFDDESFVKRIIEELRRRGDGGGGAADFWGGLPGDITFERNTAQIKPAARRAIIAASQEGDVKNSGGTIFVLGHADEIHFRESPDHIEKEIRINERLSNDRAQAVARLVAGAAPSLRVYYLGLGSAIPIQDNIAGSGNTANRRVGFVLCKVYSECEEGLRRLMPTVQPHYPASISYAPRRIEAP